jgi:hypothetical protein
LAEIRPIADFLCDDLGEIRPKSAVEIKLRAFDRISVILAKNKVTVQGSTKKGSTLSFVNQILL